jgi:hypothetical protein
MGIKRKKRRLIISSHVVWVGFWDKRGEPFSEIKQYPIINKKGMEKSH